MGVYEAMRGRDSLTWLFAVGVGLRSVNRPDTDTALVTPSTIFNLCHRSPAVLFNDFTFSNGSLRLSSPFRSLWKEGNACV